MAFQESSSSSSSSSSFVHFVVDSTTSFIHSSNSPSFSADSFAVAPKFPVTSGLESTVTTEPSASSLSIYLKIIIGSFLVLVILVSIFGNVLVCVAISSDRRLRKLGNLFIVSLGMFRLFILLT